MFQKYYFTFNILRILLHYCLPTMSFSATWARVILWLESFVSVDITNLGHEAIMTVTHPLESFKRRFTE